MSPHHATAELMIVDKDRADAALAALRALAEQTLAEPGCVQFDFHQDRADPRRILLWETFRDAAALEAHLAAPHTRHYFTLGLTELVRVIKTQRI